MSRFEIDDQFLNHHKTRRALRSGGDALVMWLAMRTYVATNNSDGVVPDEDIDDLPGAPADPRRWLEVLVQCGRPLPGGLRGNGLVDAVEGGWLLHDYRDHGLSPDEIERRRELSRDRKRRWRMGRVGIDTTDDQEHSAKESSRVPSRVPSRGTEHSCHASRHASRDAPDPIRSNPKISEMKPLSKDLSAIAREETLPSAPTEDPADPVTTSDARQSSNLPPVTAPTTSAATSQPPPVSRTRQKPILDDPFRRSLEPQTELVEQLFEAWRDEAGKPGATLDGRGLQFWRRLAHEGVTVEQVRDAMRGAKLDDWARDTAQLAPSPILGTAEQRLKFIGIGKSPPRSTSKTRQRPPQPNDENNRYVPPRVIR